MHLHPFQRIRIIFTISSLGRTLLHWVSFSKNHAPLRVVKTLYASSFHQYKEHQTSNKPTIEPLFSISHTTNHHHRVVTTKKAETRQLFCYWLCRWEILLRSVGSSVQRGQTAVVAAAVVVVVGQYFRVTFHGRRGLCCAYDGRLYV